MNQQFLQQGTIQRALIALDLSDMDRQVLDYLAFLSTKITIEKMIFLHVEPEFDIYRSTYFPAYTIAKEPGLSDEKIANVIQEKINTAFGTSSDHLAAEIVIRTGNTLETIIAQEKEWAADLIVIGDKDRDHTRGILKKNVVRKANAPVLLIPEGAEKDWQWTLVPIDFSAHSARALDTALKAHEVMSPGPATLTLHIYDLPPLHPYMVNPPGEFAPNLVESTVRNAAKKFVGQAQSAVSMLIAVESIVMAKPVSQSIADCIFTFAAKRKSPGIIVIGAKGHTRLERLLLGSVTENLISKDQSLPILVVK